MVPRGTTRFSGADPTRLPTGLDLRAISMIEGVRAGLAAALPVAASVWLEQPLLSLAALGALLTCICDPGGPWRRRLPVLLASEDVYTNHIHADDLARLCIAALARGGRGRVYNAVDDTELKMGDFLDLVAQRHGLPAPPRATADEVRKAVSEAMWSFMAESRRISNRRIGHELRTRLRYPNVHAGLPAAARRSRPFRCASAISA